MTSASQRSESPAGTFWSQRVTLCSRGASRHSAATLTRNNSERLRGLDKKGFIDEPYFATIQHHRILASAAATIAAMTVYNVYRARKAEREYPPAGQFVTVDGVRLHYIERGEGPPVVLVNRNVVTAKDFDTCGVLDLVAQRHRVIAFDRPGFGYSDRPHGSAWSAGTQADLLRDAFAVLGVNRPIVLGHSWGAAVALALGLNHPDAVKGLVLLSGYTIRRSAPTCCSRLRPRSPSSEICCAFQYPLSLAEQYCPSCSRGCSPLSPCRHVSRRAFPAACLYDQGKFARRVKTASR